MVPGVEGSSPFTHLSFPLLHESSFLFSIGIDAVAPVAMPENSGYGPGGPLAQLAEQLTLNQRVRSSSLRAPTNHFKDLAGNC